MFCLWKKQKELFFLLIIVYAFFATKFSACFSNPFLKTTPLWNKVTPKHIGTDIVMIRAGATSNTENQHTNSLCVKYVFDSNVLKLKDSMETSLEDLENKLCASGICSPITTNSEDIESNEHRSFGKFEIYQEKMKIDEIKTEISKEELEAEVLIRCKAASKISEAMDAKCSKRKVDLSDACVFPEDGMPISSKFTFERQVATYAVRRACFVARGLQAELMQKGSISKSDSSPVTVADFTVQAIVLSILSLYFPEDGFIAEETSGVLKQDPAALEAVVELTKQAISSSFTTEDVCAAIDLGGKGHFKRTWVLDPIDGTKGFIRGEQFCVALGFLKQGTPRIGILGCPNLPHRKLPNEGKKGCIFIAESGCGTYSLPLSGVGSSSLRVSMKPVTDPSSTSFCESVEASHSMHQISAAVAENLGIASPPVRIDSQCKYGVLARGEGDIYLRLPNWGYIENIWDHCAGYVVVKEAGGVVTDATGSDLIFDRKGGKLSNDVAGIVAAHSNIFPEVLQQVKLNMMKEWVAKVGEARQSIAWHDRPELPGVRWLSDEWKQSLDYDWWTLEQERFSKGQLSPAMIRTESQFATMLEKGWNKLSVVLFHARWSTKLQTVMSSLRKMCTEDYCSINLMFFEADVGKMVRVAQAQDLKVLPCMHIYYGGRKIDQYEFPSNVDEDKALVEIRERVVQARTVVFDI